MAEMKKVSWRTVGYAALGSTALIAAAIGIVHSDGVRPASLKSSAATRWLVYQKEHLLVLADGLSGKVLAKIDADPKSDSNGEFAAQGAGGAFLVAPSQGTVRAISTASLQLGTPQVVSALVEGMPRTDLGVGTNGLTVVNPKEAEAAIVAAGDVTRKINVQKADDALVARDGSMWLFDSGAAVHVGVDETTQRYELRGTVSDRTTIGSKAVTLDRTTRTIHWLEGGDVPLTDIPNAADAVLQMKGDDSPCVWVGAGSVLACVGETGIIGGVKHISGLNIASGDRLAVTGSVAAVVHGGTNVTQRIDLETESLITTGNPSGVPLTSDLTVTATNGMIWIDDEDGVDAWVISQFGSKLINKADKAAPTVNAQGQVTSPGTGSAPDPAASGNAPGTDSEQDHLDHNGVDDPPTAVDDSVTARAGDTVTIPVTANDYDPDGDPIAVLSVGTDTKAGHGTADVLDGGSVTYVPVLGYSGPDEFDYTITDPSGHQATATVHLQLLPADSPNRPPIATPDNHVKTRVGHAVTIDVLANDIDPERDTLKVANFSQNGSAKITDTVGPTGLAALRYDPPSTAGIYDFLYQAADPEGGTSEKTKVTVEVLPADAPNQPPDYKPDAIRLPVGKTAPIDVKANDVDPDGDELIISNATGDDGVRAEIRSQVMDITLNAGAKNLSVVHYTVSDQTQLPGHELSVPVLVVKIGDTAPNRPPVANPDTERVVVGNSVKIPVTANDADPENDPIALLSVGKPDGGVGTTAIEGNSVRFTPNLPNITEPTPVKFTYKISDGNGNVAIGNVTVTVLAEPLPAGPSARDDYADTITDKPVIINVLANDTDPSGGTPNLVGNPVCTNVGVATATSDQRVTFTPPAGQTGTFRCKYNVTNGQGQAQAWIIVTVTAPPPGNHDPELIAAGLFQSVDVGKSLPISVNDVAHDPDSGDVLVFAAASLSKQGTGMTDFSAKTSTFTYTAPTSSANDTPSAANIDVTITDGHVYIHATISITINNPVTTQPAPLTHQIERATTLDVPVPPIDVPAELLQQNNGVQLTLQAATVDPQGASATLKIDTTAGTVQITPQQTGIVIVNYVVQGPDKQTATGRIRLTVADPPIVNPAPVAVADELTVSSGGSGSVDVTLNDLNVSDPGDAPVWTLKDRPPASFGTISMSNGKLTLIATPDVVEKQAVVHYVLTDGNNPAVTGNVTLTILACNESPPAVRAASEFTPYATPYNIDLNQYVSSGHIINSSINGAGLTGPTGTYTPPAGMNDSVTVTYTVANGCGQTAPGLLTIDVNQAPVANSISRELSAGAPAVTLLPTDLASDSPQEQLSIQNLGGNPGWVTTDGSTLVIAPPSSTGSGLYSFSATIADPGGLTAVATVNITITNLPPTAVADAFFTDTNLFTFNPTLNDFDSEPGPLTVQVITPVDPNDQVTWTPGSNIVTVTLEHGVNKFNYTIADSGGLTASSTVTITSNRAPTVADVQGSTNNPSLDVTLEPNDPDGDSLSVTCNAPPAYFDVTIINDPDPGPPPEPNKIRLHIMLLQPAPVTAAFFCTFTDPYGATASAQVSVSFS